MIPPSKSPPLMWVIAHHPDDYEIQHILPEDELEKHCFEDCECGAAIENPKFPKIILHKRFDKKDVS